MHYLNILLEKAKTYQAEEFKKKQQLDEKMKSKKEALNKTFFELLTILNQFKGVTLYNNYPLQIESNVLSHDILLYSVSDKNLVKISLQYDDSCNLVLFKSNLASTSFNNITAFVDYVIEFLVPRIKLAKIVE